MSERSRPRDATVSPPWPLPPGWLLHDDGDVVVACKPVGVSVSAPERGSKHDLMARVRLLRRGTSPDAYLGAQMHLDRDASGVVVFAGYREANAALARPGAIAVSYLVTTVAPAGFEAQGSLSAHVVKDRTGVLRPVSRKTRGAKPIRVSYRLVDRCGDRVLLEIDSSDGARAIRAALAAHALAVAGDAAFEGPKANRLMLHAKAARFRHPRSGQPVHTIAPTPWSLEAWMRGKHRAAQLEPATLEAALAESAALRFALVADTQTDAFRMVHGEAEGLLGLDVEWLGPYAVVWVHEETPPEVTHHIVDTVHASGAKGTYVKVRPKQASRIVHANDAALASTHAVRGTDAPQALIVRERDLALLVHLGEGLSTGLFLDQRPNRTWLRSHSDKKAVLNLFAYTCAFTVAAAVGGACRTVSVDISKRSLQIGARNLELNGIASDSHALVCDDVGAWVEHALREGQRFDIVLLDPPSFGTSRQGRFSVMADYVPLAAACMSLLEPGGTLLACTNHRGVTRAKLHRWLRQAASRAARGPLDLQDAPTAPDFPAAPHGEPHMKAVICRLDAGPPPRTASDARRKGRSSRSRRTKSA